METEAAPMPEPAEKSELLTQAQEQRLPVFTVETPALLGMPTPEGANFRQKFDGERTMEVALMPCYIHGALQDAVGYDIPCFASGDVKDVEQQPCLVISQDLAEREAVLVGVTLPHAGKPTRAAFIVTPEEVDETLVYLTGKVRNTSKRSPRPFL